MRYANGTDANPRWIQLMYSDTADLGKVTEAYTKYYQTHTFVKTSTHNITKMARLLVELLLPSKEYIKQLLKMSNLHLRGCQEDLSILI